MDTSSADTGSSSTTSRGDSASDRAMAMRWRWPPENSWGNSSAERSGSPTSSSRWRMRLRTSPAESDSLVTRGSAMMAPTRMRGLSEANGSWKTACTDLR